MTERCVSINVPAMTRVEGEGSLRLRIEHGRIEELALDIFEPPRYFEKFLEGRRYHEVMDIVARICGICPIAYQMSAAQALENAFGIKPGCATCGGCSIAANGYRAMRCMCICWPHRIFWASTA